jgi:hypothetical protein
MLLCERPVSEPLAEADRLQWQNNNLPSTQQQPFAVTLMQLVIRTLDAIENGKSVSESHLFPQPGRKGTRAGIPPSGPKPPNN